MDLYAKNLTEAQANAGSNKRLTSIVRNRFYPKTKLTKPPFDDRVRDVITDYALKGVNVDEANKHLDAIGYGAKPDHLQMLKALENFSSVHATNRAWMEGFKTSKKALINLFKREFCHELIPYTFTDNGSIMDALPKLNAHAGWAYIQSGLREKGDYSEEIYALWNQSLTVVRAHGSHGFPILPGSRLQCSGGYDEGVPTQKVKHKERLVNMIDIRQIISEMVFSIPFQKAMSYSSIYTGVRNPSELGSLICNRRGASQSWVSLDYSGYDQSVPGWLVRESFDVIQATFNHEAFKHVSWLWDAVVYDFTNAPIIGKDGLVRRKDGVPSGSMFTQLIDTIANWLMIETWANMVMSRDGIKPRMNMLICGDDNLIFFNDRRNPRDAEADMLSYIGHVFGIKGNADKFGAGDSRVDDPQFLSRSWRWSGAWREWHELFAHMVYPERFRNYLGNPMLSAPMIVWSYCLVYPSGMRDLIDVKRFVEDYRLHIPHWSVETMQEAVPGYLKFQVQYLHRRIADVLQ